MGRGARRIRGRFVTPLGAGATSELADLAVAEGRYRGLSLWWDELPGDVRPRSPLTTDGDVDVVVVGAGFTGLWTAHALACADPSMRIAVVEAEVAGYGASGRNGGWCSALFPASESRLAREHGPEAARGMRLALQATVDEVGRVASAEGIDCRFAKGGTVVVARDGAQVARARSEVERGRALGIGEDDLRFMGPEEARQLLDVPGILGATYTPHCASIDPARLVRGLADAVERRGVRIYEGSPVLEISGGGTGTRPSARTRSGTVRADVVVRAVEAWTPQLSAARRIAPVYSLMIATEPLDDAFWDGTGLAHRETFADHRHLIVYGQRTADGRIAFGGRGAPYHFASSVRDAFDRDPKVHAALLRDLVGLFPRIEDVAITHRWGGPLGVPRDWFPSAGFDPVTGLAWAGGYVGDGVAASNLAGRTLADLILRRETELTSLPWVGHESPAWEPEPLRWLGINGALWATKMADRHEGRTGRPSRAGARLERLLGG